MRPRQQAGPAVACGEPAIEIPPWRAGMSGVGTGPLQALHLPQSLSRHPGQIARPASGEADEFVPDLVAAGIVKAAEAELLAHCGDDFPIRSRGAGWSDDPLAEADHPFAVG